MSAFWQPVTIPSGQTRRWEISFLDLQVQRREGEWKVWHELNSEEAFEDRFLFAQEDTEPERSSSMRYVANGSASDLEIVPAFPDRPIVSYPGVPIIVPPKSEASFVCGIPLWVSLVATSEDNPQTLISLPLRRLSKTWFGSPQEGEACYSASTQAVLDHRELAPNKHRALCPLTVTNKSRSPLPIDRICVHVEHLQLLEGSEYLWTNEVYVRKESEHDTSQVSYGSGAPRLDPKAELRLSPREVPPQKRLLLKTFNQLKTVLGNQ